MPVQDPTQRFSSRVDNYVRYRPGYPPEVVSLLKSECGLTPNSVIADIASGTGIFTRLLLGSGSRVLGVEPNPEMRRAGEEFLTAYPRFTSVAGSAEVTTLPEHSADIVTAAQAAHWFDPPKTRRELLRILKPNGWCVLLWNERQTDTTPFLRAYEELLRTYGTDYQDVRHERTTATIDSFFTPSPFQERVFENKQELDYAALEGRLLSSSYTPQPNDAGYDPMLLELRRIFDAHQSRDRITVEYKTKLFFGRLS
jgi:ubiquinone/menaquinone biosynthesis C-methylase UbiE